MKTFIGEPTPEDFAWATGLKAAPRSFHDISLISVPKCPFPTGELSIAWWEGMAIGTEDFMLAVQNKYGHE